MRKLLLSAAAFAALTAPAYASGPNCAGFSQCNQTTNNTTNNQGGTGIGIGKGGNASANSKNRNTNVNANRQGQDQSQGQLQGQAQGQVIDWNAPRNTAGASAPGLIAGADSCIQSQSIGGQTPAFGLSLGITHDDAACERRKNASVMFGLGYTDAARELMCQDDDVREAMLTGGSPCNADKVSVTTEAANENLAITTYDGETLVPAVASIYAGK